jgi:hypothetical protein
MLELVYSFVIPLKVIYYLLVVGYLTFVYNQFLKTIIEYLILSWTAWWSWHGNDLWGTISLWKTTENFPLWSSFHVPGTSHLSPSCLIDVIKLSLVFHLIMFEGIVKHMVTYWIGCTDVHLSSNLGELVSTSFQQVLPSWWCQIRVRYTSNPICWLDRSLSQFPIRPTALVRV